jgi:hypothetical protein
MQKYTSFVTNLIFITLQLSTKSCSIVQNVQSVFKNPSPARVYRISGLNRPAKMFNLFRNVQVCSVLFRNVQLLFRFCSAFKGQMFRFVQVITHFLLQLLSKPIVQPTQRANQSFRLSNTNRSYAVEGKSIVGC